MLCCIKRQFRIRAASSSAGSPRDVGKKKRYHSNVIIFPDLFTCSHQSDATSRFNLLVSENLKRYLEGII